jgi:hypothetical protein
VKCMTRCEECSIVEIGLSYDGKRERGWRDFLAWCEFLLVVGFSLIWFVYLVGFLVHPFYLT